METTAKNEVRISSNGWQNIGVFSEYIWENNLNTSEAKVFMWIVKSSVGFGQTYTNRTNLGAICKKIDISKPTLIKAVKSLEDKNLIQIIHHKGFIYGGGKKAYCYGPVFPKNIKIWLKNNSKSKSEPTEKQPWF